MRDRETKALAYGVGLGGLAGVVTAISLSAETCKVDTATGSLNCVESPNYQAGLAVGLISALLAAVAFHEH